MRLTGARNMVKIISRPSAPWARTASGNDEESKHVWKKKMRRGINNKAKKAFRGAGGSRADVAGVWWLPRRWRLRATVGGKYVAAGLRRRAGISSAPGDCAPKASSLVLPSPRSTYTPRTNRGQELGRARPFICRRISFMLATNGGKASAASFTYLRFRASAETKLASKAGGR